MEQMGVVADGEWDSFSKMFTNEDFDFTHQQFGFHQNDAGLHFVNTSPFCATSETNESLFFSNNFLNFSRDNSSSGGDSSNCSSFFIPMSAHESYFFNDNNDDHHNNNVMMSVKNHHHDHDHDDASMAMDICIMDHKSIGSHVSAFSDDGTIVANNVNDVNFIGDKLGKVENNGERSEARVSPATESQLKRKFDAPGLHTRGGDDRSNANSSENLKKKPRVSNRGKKNVITNKNGQIQNGNGMINGGEESNGGSEGQSSSSYCSEEENASQETNGGAISTSSESKASLALNLNGKPRAGRGSATDPQSLYARKRRERINERLKILQNLVPNGTKVDISTMLEEAVHYVKFLQLQIKLLSSDEHWMYAPIAYNGMDIGLNQKLSSLV